MIANPSASQHRGFTLVELMIAIAILSILTAIAIPAYNGYVREGYFATMRGTLNGLRTLIEDYRLDTGSYGTTGDLVGQAAIDGRFGWDPGTDITGYAYTVSVVAADDYHVWGQHGLFWVRCENRFNKCCDSESGGADPSAACP